ncbi:MAG: PrgI family protein [Ruminococcus sp.]|nr:PrgI family protein [Ruminococcus sp.]
MAHYVQIPKDLNDIKEKFMFGLTKRQVISFGIGFVIGIPVFFLTRGFLGLSGAIIAMGCCAAPAIICGVYKKNGMFFEQVVKQMIAYFKSPRKRIYRTTNAYECMDRQIEYLRLKKALDRAEGGKRG